MSTARWSTATTRTRRRSSRHAGNAASRCPSKRPVAIGKGSDKLMPELIGHHEGSYEALLRVAGAHEYLEARIAPTMRSKPDPDIVQAAVRRADPESAAAL